ncbi:MAG: tRNA pseudouridine(55) synthase TruB [Chitinophagaceae bacterium]|nr:MAG: tRNA pseudouridine(55) synthase TruB [Chitinophagaceae bacterium]
MSKHYAEENIYTSGQVILVNKPLHWTSFDVVRKIRNLTKSKVGHAGTLDPLATGLLICCTGKFTKQISAYQAQEKEYTGTFTIGAETPTYDLESEPQHFKDYSTVTSEQILLTAEKFTGNLSQIPPVHSAVKKDGKPLYHSARKGLEVKAEPRNIFIKEVEITNIALPRIHFRVVCSTGTYIRSLAFDFGKALGCGAYLSALCRTRIGQFLLKDAYQIDTVEEVIRTSLLKTDSQLQNLK